MMPSSATTADIDENRAEAHGKKQRGLDVFFDREEDEQSADRPHHRLRPRYVFQRVYKKFHKNLRFYY